MEEQALGHHARQRERTRHAIVAAGRDLFVEVGYDDARTAEIARRADVSEPTLFRHFAGKAAIALAPFDDLCTALLDRFEAGLTGATPYEVIVTMLGERVGADRASGPARQAMAMALHHPELAAHLFWGLNSAIHRLIPAIAAQRHTAVDDIDPVVTAHLVVVPVQVAIRRWLESDGTVEPFASVTEAVELLRPQLDY